MEFFTILISAIKESLASNLNFETLGAITLVSLVLYLLYFFGLKLKTKLHDKKQNSYEHQTGLSIPEKQHLEELKAIKTKMASGSNEPIRIDAVKALYIAQNWDEYNLVASEDSKIMFEKMKSFEDVVDVSTTPSRNSLPSSLEPRAALRTEYLGGTEFKIYSDVGYTHFKDGLMIESKLFGDEDKKAKNKKGMTLEDKEAQVKKAQKALEEDEPEVVLPEPKSEPTKKMALPPEAPIVKSETSSESEPKSLDAFLASLSKNKSVEPEVQNATEPKVQQPIAATPQKKSETASVIECPEPVVTKKSKTPAQVTSPLPSSSQTPSDKSAWLQDALTDADQQDIFVDDTPLLDPKAIADLVAGKKPSSPKTPTPKLEYDMLYSFENVKSFFGSSFLSEPDKSYKQKLINFLAFLSKHPFVFFVNGHQTMLVHVDSFVMALARTVMEENRKVFLDTFYPDGSFSNDALCKALEQFQNRLMLMYDHHFMFFSNLQSGQKAYMFTRALKTSGKIVKGEFVIFQFKNATRVLVEDVANLGFENSEVIATKASELDSIGGKRLKLKTKEEILNVL